MPICWSVVTTEVTAFARSAGVAGSAARVSFRYEPPPNMANRTLAATESWATGSPGCGFGVPAQTAWWTGAQAEHTFTLAWADSWSLYECEAPGRSHAAMATAVAITAIAMATNATERGDVHQPTKGECFSLLSARETSLGDVCVVTTVSHHPVMRCVFVGCGCHQIPSKPNAFGCLQRWPGLVGGDLSQSCSLAQPVSPVA